MAEQLHPLAVLVADAAADAAAVAIILLPAAHGSLTGETVFAFFSGTNCVCLLSFMITFCIT